MYVCVFWVLSCCHTLHPTAGCNYHRDRVHKREKTKNQKNKNPHKIIIHSPYPYSSFKKKKNHPESPGKNHVTYPRKAVPVITGYGLSTSLILCICICFYVPYYTRKITPPPASRWMDFRADFLQNKGGTRDEDAVFGKIPSRSFNRI